ncbi:MAG: guanylate kinase [Lachnospiraceae bacterium]|nr:guanylate kinase [Lachnospiraceae bacterium]
MKKGTLLVISGFAGSGKGTIVKRLLSEYDTYSVSVSATTRAPRPGEVDGKDYFFVTKEKFEEMIADDEFLEYARYVDNYYGSPRGYVDKMLDEGRDVILEIEQQGALKVKAGRPDALLMFVMPPSVREIYNRLKKRGTESEEVIMKRMHQGAREADVIEKYDYLIINDDLGECVRNVHETVCCSKYAAVRNKELIDRIRSEFNDFLNV